VLAGASGRENCLVHISADLVRSERENGCFVLQTKLRFVHLYRKFALALRPINSSSTAL
jgi:hypothetical protein